MKPSNLTTPRSLSEASFYAWSDPIERPEDQRPGLLAMALRWAAIVLAVWSGLWFLLTRT